MQYTTPVASETSPSGSSQFNLTGYNSTQQKRKGDRTWDKYRRTEKRMKKIICADHSDLVGKELWEYPPEAIAEHIEKQSRHENGNLKSAGTMDGYRATVIHVYEENNKPWIRIANV